MLSSGRDSKGGTSVKIPKLVSPASRASGRVYCSCTDGLDEGPCMC